MSLIQRLTIRIYMKFCIPCDSCATLDFACWYCRHYCQFWHACGIACSRPFCQFAFLPQPAACVFPAWPKFICQGKCSSSKFIRNYLQASGSFISALAYAPPNGRISSEIPFCSNANFIREMTNIFYMMLNKNGNAETK